MCPVPALVLFQTLRLLLPLAAWGWGPAVASPVWSNTDDPVHLYTSSNRKNFHLQIHPDGRVDGSPAQTVNSALVIKAVSAGYVVISGAKNRLFLCMHSNGTLFGSRSFSSNDCVFKHTLLENNFDVYESRRHNFLVSLGKVKGSLTRHMKALLYYQFLTRKNEIPLNLINTPRPQQEEPGDVDGKSCDGILTGMVREESLGEAGIDPCFTKSE